MSLERPREEQVGFQRILALFLEGRLLACQPPTQGPQGRRMVPRASPFPEIYGLRFHKDHGALLHVGR